MFTNPRELPDDLLPYSGKLSDRFYEVRQNVAEFCQEIKAYEDAGWPAGSQDELKAKARERNLWNFFLPEVSGITVICTKIGWGPPQFYRRHASIGGRGVAPLLTPSFPH